jgi:hypothetical protein
LFALNLSSHTATATTSKKTASKGMSQVEQFNTLPFSFEHEIPIPTSCALCDIFSTCFENERPFYHQLRRRYQGLDSYSETVWESTPSNVLSRQVTYSYGNDSIASEEQYISLDNRDEGAWRTLKLSIRTAVSSGLEGQQTTILWQLCFNIAANTLQCTFRSEPIPSAMALNLCDQEHLSSVITDTLQSIIHLDDDNAYTWFLLVESSIAGEYADANQQAERRIQENFNQILHRPQEPVVETIPVPPPRELSPPIPSEQYMAVEQSIYYSIKLGIQFRIQNNSVFVGGVESEQACIDDLPAIHSLDAAYIDIVKERCGNEDEDFCRALLSQGPVRPLDLTQKASLPTPGIIPEHLWSEGLDTGQPTYYINAIAPRKPSSVPVALPTAAVPGSGYPSAVPSTSAEYITRVYQAEVLAAVGAASTPVEETRGTRPAVVTSAVVLQPLEVHSLPCLLSLLLTTFSHRSIGGGPL